MTPDPRSTIERLVTALYEAGRPMTIDELAAATKIAIEHVCLACAVNAKQRYYFVQVAPQTYTLRSATRAAVRWRKENEARKAARLAAITSERGGAE